MTLEGWSADRKGLGESLAHEAFTRGLNEVEKPRETDIAAVLSVVKKLMNQSKTDTGQLMCIPNHRGGWTYKTVDIRKPESLGSRHL